MHDKKAQKNCINKSSLKSYKVMQRMYAMLALKLHLTTLIWEMYYLLKLENEWAKYNDVWMKNTRSICVLSGTFEYVAKKIQKKYH